MEDAVRFLSLGLLALALAPSPPAVAPQEKEPILWGKLRAQIESLDRNLDGVLGVAVKDLKTGATIEVRGDRPFPTASSIKVAVLYELYRQAEEGRIDLSQTTRPPVPRAKGGGVLQELGGAVSLTWRDLAVLMMGWSDNEATNVLIEQVGMEAVNDRLAGLGLRETRLRRRMMDLAAARRGDENVATPAELNKLMETIYEGKGLSSERAKDIVSVAAKPKWGSGPNPPSPFRLPLPDTLMVADKTGELEGVRCVTALVYLPERPYAATIMTTYLRSDDEGEAVIRDISAAVFQTLDRLGRASSLGRIISER